VSSQGHQHVRSPTLELQIKQSLPNPADGHEFYFSLPYDRMDLCLYGKNNGYSAEDIAPVVNLTSEQVQKVFDDIDGKRKTTKYLHLPPMLVGEVPEIKKDN
jgi:NAD+ synthase